MRLDEYKELSYKLYSALVDRLEIFEDNLAIDIGSDVPEYDASYCADQPSIELLRAQEAYIDAIISDLLDGVY